jgi:predicted ABC-type ATPase
VSIIKRRYKKGISNLVNVFLNLCEYWIIIDNSHRPYTLIAEGNGENETTVYNNQTWLQIKKEANEKRENR